MIFHTLFDQGKKYFFKLESLLDSSYCLFQEIILRGIFSQIFQELRVATVVVLIKYPNPYCS